jgi:hypothetical protein
VGSGDKVDVVPAGPGTSLEVVQAESVLEFAVVVLDAPADLGQADQFGDRSVGEQVGQPVGAGCPGAVGPFDQQRDLGI